MFQGNWMCSKCGGSITELPFEPRGTAGLTCRACYAKSRGDSTSGSSSTSSPEPEPMMEVVGEEAPWAPDEAGLATEPSPDDGFPDAVPATPSEKPKFAGNWKCATCGGDITSLPFQPRDVTNLKCIDCFKQSRG